MTIVVVTDEVPQVMNMLSENDFQRCLYQYKIQSCMSYSWANDSDKDFNSINPN